MSNKLHDIMHSGMRELLISAHTAAMQIAEVTDPARVQIEFNVFTVRNDNDPCLFTIRVSGERRNEPAICGSGLTLDEALVHLRDRFS